MNNIKNQVCYLCSSEGKKIKLNYELNFQESERGDFPAKSGITRLVQSNARENFRPPEVEEIKKLK